MRIFGIIVLSLAFTCCVEAQEVTIDNEHVYTLTTERGFLLYRKSMKMVCASSGSGFTVPNANPSDKNQLFAILEVDGEKYLYNVAANQFVTATGSLVFAPTHSLTLEKTTSSTNPWQLFIGQNCINVQEKKENIKAGVVYNTWIKQDAGNMFALAYGTQPEDLDLQIIIDRIKEYNDCGNLTIDTRNGNIFQAAKGGALPEKFNIGQAFSFSPQPIDGYTTDSIEILWGKNLENTYMVDGRKTSVTIPADKTYGNLHIKAHWERTDAEADVLVFSDEFDSSGEPTSKKWSRTVRQNATWNRWCSNSKLVVYEKDGALHCLALPNPDKSKDNVAMLTGGIKSQGKFSFRYGRAEARLKTTQHTGNFPAFWMMPADNKYGGWPYSGEIDIWETIDNSTNSWHTVHTEWTYVLGKGGNSKAFSGMDYSLWHVYRMDWDEKSITWYADGQKVWTYSRSTDKSQLDQGQWPFDQPFYLILNQSVGNGSWAANADTGFTYETQFDWVRVYQPAELTGISDIHIDHNSDRLYNLSGQMVNDDYKGIVIKGGKKYLR